MSPSHLQAAPAGVLVERQLPLVLLVLQEVQAQVQVGQLRLALPVLPRVPTAVRALQEVQGGEQVAAPVQHLAAQVRFSHSLSLIPALTLQQE